MLHHKVDEHNHRIYQPQYPNDEEIESVTKNERAMCWPECFKAILKSENVKTCLILSVKFPFLRQP